MHFCSQLPLLSSPVSVKSSLLALNRSINDGEKIESYKSETACFLKQTEE